MSFKDLTTRAAAALKPNPTEASKRTPKDKASEIGPDKPVAEPEKS